MSRVPLAIQPGVYKNGTDFQAAGRWVDAWHTRWYGGALGNTLGWRTRGDSTVTGAARAVHLWKDNLAITYIGVGTHNHLYVSKRDGSIYDITPSGLTSGRVDAIAAGGYGSGSYGVGTFGTPRLDSSLVLDATVWSLDHFGQYLLGNNPDDRKLYQWTLDTSVIAAAVSGAPDGDSVVVTAEGFAVVLASTDPRTFSWCDQQDITTWTPSATNQAGDYTLQTPGRLMCGKVVQGLTLLFTDQDVWKITYTLGNSIFETKKVGDACGVISRQAVASYDMQAAWMSKDATFWTFNGYTQPLECDVQDYVRNDINLLQSSKAFATVNSASTEIEWRYCSANSTEIDRCVVWNYLTKVWTIGRVSRLCGSDKQAGFTYPIYVDSTGLIYDHEVGYSYGDVAPKARTGPITLGQGDTVMNVLGFYPDDITAGDVSLTIYYKNNPDDNYSTYGPVTLTSKTDLRLQARQMEFEYTMVNNTTWRVGTGKLEVIPGGRR